MPAGQETVSAALNWEEPFGTKINYYHFLSISEEERSMSSTYRSEDMDVLVACDQMGVLSGARRRLKLISREHPNLHTNQEVTCSKRAVFVIQREIPLKRVTA